MLGDKPKFSCGDEVWAVLRMVIADVCSHCGQDWIRKDPNGVKRGVVDDISLMCGIRAPVYHVDFGCDGSTFVAESDLFYSPQDAIEFVVNHGSVTNSVGDVNTCQS